MYLDNPSKLGESAGSYDVVVVGAGPVGITLAMKLADGGRKVLLLEGGGENYSDESQNRYGGVIRGMDWDQFKYIDGLRLRYMGGTSNHWVGYCVRLDKGDVGQWPIAYEDLYRNSSEAEAILEIDSFDAAESQVNGAWVSSSSEDRLHEIKPILRSPPVRFKEKYDAPLRGSSRITVCLNANLVDVGLSADMASVEWLAVARDPGSRSIKIPAQKVVFAMGAIECTRYMLAESSTKCNTDLLN